MSCLECPCRSLPHVLTLLSIGAVTGMAAPGSCVVPYQRRGVMSPTGYADLTVLRCPCLARPLSSSVPRDLACLCLGASGRLAAPDRCVPPSQGAVSCLGVRASRPSSPDRGWAQATSLPPPPPRPGWGGVAARLPFGVECAFVAEVTRWTAQQHRIVLGAACRRSLAHTQPHDGATVARTRARTRAASGRLLPCCSSPPVQDPGGTRRGGG